MSNIDDVIRLLRPCEYCDKLLFCVAGFNPGFCSDDMMRIALDMIKRGEY